jgi:hypothetical protein
MALNAKIVNQEKPDFLKLTVTAAYKADNASFMQQKLKFS